MSKKQRRTKKMSDQLRAAIESCGWSLNELDTKTGIDKSTLSRFMSGERGLSMKALDRLGKSLDLEVVMHRTKD